jgi:hypothetical protein
MSTSFRFDALPRRAALVLPALLLAAAATAQPAPFTPADLATARALAASGLKADLGYELVDSLVTEVGPRPAGSAGDARAVAWALARLKALGFPQVRAEELPLRVWQRGEARASLSAPYAHTLVVAALGNSVATPPQGLDAELAYYADLEALKADTSDRARGRIVFIDQKTDRTPDGRGYGRAVVARATGTTEAAKRGALALAIRSIGTDRDRFPHTGATRYTEGVAAIPALAVSVPDADLIARLQRYDQPVRMSVALQTRGDVPAITHNVIAEIPGTDKAAEVVMIGAHLDSWDLGPGALDDGAGVGIVIAAAKLILDSGVKPRRTVRVVLFGNEENGFDGAVAYANRYREQVHQLVAESDLGAGLVYRFQSRVRPEALAAVQLIAEQLAPLKIAAGSNEGNPGPDAGVLMRRNAWPALELSQDGSEYFDVHHTANDTLDKIDPAKLRQNVAAWALMTWLAAQADVAFGPLPRPASP